MGYELTALATLPARGDPLPKSCNLGVVQHMQPSALTPVVDWDKQSQCNPSGPMFPLWAPTAVLELWKWPLVL